MEIKVVAVGTGFIKSTQNFLATFNFLIYIFVCS